MGSILWWGKNILIVLVALFFLVFGIETLIGTFNLKNPLEFIMYFFSASLVVLVSFVGFLYPAFQIHQLLKMRKRKDDDA
jgi:di/tricarboxylate transporter